LVPPPSHLTSCTPTKSNSYSEISSATALSKHIRFLSLRLFIQGICPGLRLLVIFRNKLNFYGEKLLAPCPTPKLKDHPLSAVCDCLFNIFTATFHIWRPSPPSTT
jgi:hypothetical protein